MQFVNMNCWCILLQSALNSYHIVTHVGLKIDILHLTLMAELWSKYLHILSLYEYRCILCQISLKIVPKGPITRNEQMMSNKG